MNRLLTFFLFVIMLSSCGSQKDKLSEVDAKSVSVEKPKGIFFEVSDVEMAKLYLKVDSAKCVFENKIGKEIMFFPEEHAGLRFVSSPNNGLIQTIQECYDTHRPLILTPDVIWLAICQGVSIHINEHFDSLESVIFIKNKPKEIVIRNDSLEHSAKQWAALMESFSFETKKYTKSNFYSFFVSEFSTTTPIEKTAYQITLLESYKKAFEYVAESGCGIPSIMIAGSPKDWEKMMSKISMLDKIGLASWRKNLKPILNEFLSASKGKINQAFWKDIYKTASEYNAFYISGWIVKLFPYIKELDSSTKIFDASSGESKMNEIIVPNPFLDGNLYLLSTLSTDNFPSGVAKINVVWNNFSKNSQKNMEVYSGFFAIRQFEDLSLMPIISWAICDGKSKPVNHQLSHHEGPKLMHQSEYWSPNFANELIDSAIYDIKTYKSQSQSLQFVAGKIAEALRKTADFSGLKLEKDTVEIEVLSNGKPGHVRLIGNSEHQSLNRILFEVINALPKKWFPATCHPSNVLESDFTEEEDALKVRANSKVYIPLNDILSRKID